MVKTGPDLQPLPDAQGVAQAAADRIAARVQDNPELTVLVATGLTPMATYAELARRVRAGELDMGGVTAVQLDEYWQPGEGALHGDDPRSLWGWMQRSFVEPLGVRRTIRFGDSSDPLEVCARYDAAVQAAGGIDLAVLGLGPNGHLGFNEPPSPAHSGTRRIDLSTESLASNAVYWHQAVPPQALTTGMATILSARAALLLVTGAHKRAVLDRVLNGPQTPEVPASLLRTVGTVILADEAALGSGAPVGEP